MLAALALVATMTADVAPPAPEAAYTAEIEAWRRQRRARLTSDEGWLTVAGLFWLKEGANRFGSAPDNEIVLPAHSAPAHAGLLRRAGRKVTVEVAAGVAVTTAGKPVSKLELRSDLPGPPDVLALGDLRFFLIDRDGELAIRLRDLRSPARAAFKGLDYFPVRPDLRVSARFVPHPQAKTLKVPNVLGRVSDMQSPGTVHFKLAGRELSLDAVLEEPGDKQLFFIFRDETAGHETYPAGRFFYADLPVDGRMVLDFNKAYTPPCGFTAFATCPLPPPQNRLPLRIEAGEKFSGHHP
jgi:uncharacterized protein (DUF1684 family)